MACSFGVKLSENDGRLVECSKDEYVTLFRKYERHLKIGKTSTFSSSRPYSVHYRLLAFCFKSGTKTFIAAEKDDGFVKYYKNYKLP